MAQLLQEAFGITNTEDLLNSFVGAFLGEGEHRMVYACTFSPEWVIKIEKDSSLRSRRFANVDEWCIWEEMLPTRWKDWLAPIKLISENSRVLIQARCSPLERRPYQVPSFLADSKRDNWGMYNGRPVCFDYANHKSFCQARETATLVEPEWHDI